MHRKDRAPRGARRGEAALSPRELARAARARLSRAAGRRGPQRATRFFKPWERVLTLGLSTPRLRNIERQLYRSVQGSWDYTAAVTCAEMLLREKHIEGRSLGLMLLARYHRSFEAGLLARARAWLARSRCDNWALTDLLSLEILGPLLQRFPALISRIEKWSVARNIWVRRAAAVSCVPLARRGVQLDATYRITTALLGDREDLIHKATGWLLREAGRTDPARLEAYLLAHGPAVPRTALRYAIERFPERRRRVILERTKAADNVVR